MPARLAISRLWVTITIVWPARLRSSSRLDDFAAGLRVEVAGWFVGEDDVGFVGERAGDGDSLAFATGELHAVGARGVGRGRRRREQLLGSFAALASGEAGEGERDLDVLAGGQHLQEVECLEDEAQGSESEGCSLLAAEILSGPIASDADFAGRWVSRRGRGVAGALIYRSRRVRRWR